MSNTRNFTSLTAAAAILGKKTTFNYPLRHGSMRVGVYAPAGTDDRTPHDPDELYIIPEVMSQDFLTWIVFWEPPGGARQQARG